MDDRIRSALGRNQIIDLTTTGRRSGEPRRIEIYLHSLDGRLVISGIPRSDRARAWLLNVAADPEVTIHLKGDDGPRADVAGTGRVVTDPSERRRLLEAVARNWRRSDLDLMLLHSPLIEVTVPGFPA
jgi:deazaflavin-dependent oxidoreductase (nitroreductase family)